MAKDQGSDSDSGPIDISDVGKEWLETDSVDVRFGGEYSDETLEMMKQYRKPEWQETESSLDPLEDFDLFPEYELRMPPPTYDAMAEAAQQEIDELNQLKDVKLSPEHERTVAYRQQLVEGTSQKDVKWLKLHAYHRGMDQLRAMRAQAETSERKQLLEDYNVPVDVVPAELISLTPEQLADRRRQAQAASRSRGKLQPLSKVQYSEESEWDPEWSAIGYLDANTREGLSLAFQGAIARRNGNAAMATSAAAQSPAAAVNGIPLGEDGDQLIFTGPDDVDKVVPWHPYRAYTPEYQAQLDTERKLKQQQRQRSLAFWLPLATVSVVYAVRTFRRLTGRGRQQGGQGSAAKGNNGANLPAAASAGAMSR